MGAILLKNHRSGPMRKHLGRIDCNNPKVITYIRS